jgi:hypothetical protein
MMIAPATASIGIDNSQSFISLRILADYLENNKILTLRNKISLDFDDQLREIKTILSSHYDQIMNLLNSDQWEDEERRIRLFQQDQMKKAFPNARFRSR